MHITSWITGNPIAEFGDLYLVKPGDFFTDFGMARVFLKSSGGSWQVSFQVSKKPLSDAFN